MAQQSATERIAAKLAARQEAKAAPAPDTEAVEVEQTEATNGHEPEGVEDLVETAEADAEQEESSEPTTIRDRAAARRAGRSTTPSKNAGSKAKSGSSAKKQPSPAQVAAREKFAAQSRARAAAKAAERPNGHPVQTAEEVKASQKAAREAERKSAVAKAEADKANKRPPSSKAKVVKAKAVVSGSPESRAKNTGQPAKAKATPAKAKAKAAPAERSHDTRDQVHSLLAKGKTIPQIVEQLGKSYASVHYHARTFEGERATMRGRVFVETPYNAEGQKLRNGKKEEVSRSEAMRRRFLSDESLTVGDVRKEFGVLYQIAYTAIRPLLGDTEGEEAE